MMEESMLKGAEPFQKMLTSQHPYLVKQQILITNTKGEMSTNDLIQRVMISLKPKDDNNPNIFREEHPNILVGKKKCTFQLAALNLLQIFTLLVLIGLVLYSVLVINVFVFYVFGFLCVLWLQIFYKRNKIWNPKMSDCLTIQKFKEKFQKFQRQPQYKDPRLLINYEIIGKLVGSDEGFSYETLKSSIQVKCNNNPNWLCAADKSQKQCVTISHECRLIISDEKQLQVIKNEIGRLLIKGQGVIQKQDALMVQNYPQIKQRKKQYQTHLFKIQLESTANEIPFAFIRKKVQGEYDRFLSIITKIFLVHSFYLRRKLSQTDSLTSLTVAHEFELVLKDT